MVGCQRATLRPPVEVEAAYIKPTSPAFGKCSPHPPLGQDWHCVCAAGLSPRGATQAALSMYQVYWSGCIFVFLPLFFSPFRITIVFVCLFVSLFSHSLYLFFFLVFVFEQASSFSLFFLFSPSLSLWNQAYSFFIVCIFYSFSFSLIFGSGSLPPFIFSFFLLPFLLLYPFLSFLPFLPYFFPSHSFFNKQIKTLLAKCPNTRLCKKGGTLQSMGLWEGAVKMQQHTAYTRNTSSSARPQTVYGLFLI